MRQDGRVSGAAFEKKKKTFKKGRRKRRRPTFILDVGSALPVESSADWSGTTTHWPGLLLNTRLQTLLEEKRSTDNKAATMLLITIIIIIMEICTALIFHIEWKHRALYNSNSNTYTPAQAHARARACTHTHTHTHTHTRTHTHTHIPPIHTFCILLLKKFQIKKNNNTQVQWHLVSEGFKESQER